MKKVLLLLLIFPFFGISQNQNVNLIDGDVWRLSSKRIGSNGLTYSDDIFIKFLANNQLIWGFSSSDFNEKQSFENWKLKNKNIIINFSAKSFKYYGKIISNNYIEGFWESSVVQIQPISWSAVRITEGMSKEKLKYDNYEINYDLLNQINKENNIEKKPVDIDIDIPKTKTKSENTYALIIGNEDYSSYQTGLNNEVDVDYGKKDAFFFKKYCVNTLGIDERHINFIQDATAGQMKQGLAWINNLAKVTDGKANLIFYYAGHGLPDQETKTPYLMPVDVSGSYINLGISLDEVITSLSQYPTKKSVIFLDACFSGGARNEGLVAMRGVKIKPKEENLLGNLVILSSSSGNESSGSYDNKKHGMFTYFLLKKLQESKGTANLKEISDYLYNEVRKESALSGKIQTPQVQSSSSVGKDWESWILAE